MSKEELLEKKESIIDDGGDNFLEANDLEVHFRSRQSFYKDYIKKEKKIVRAVDKMSFSIKKGEILSLVGESGSGKTTTGRAILDLQARAGGKVIFEGKDIDLFSKEQKKDFRQKAQMIFQDPYQSLNPRFTVFDIVTEPLLFTGESLGLAEKEQKAIEALEFAGLRPAIDYLYRYPHEMSGGQRQRVSIATCFIISPDLIIADEPVSMLDASIRADILKLFVGMKDEKGSSIIFITHDLSLAWLISDRVAIMYLGKIMEIGSADLISTGCMHPYSQALTSVLAVVGEERRQERIILEGETPSPANMPSGCRFHTRCPIVMDKCKTIEPEYKKISEGHYVYCHNPKKI